MTEDIEAFKARLRDLVLDHGFAVQHQDATVPATTYTVGRTMNARPELVISGLPIDLAKAVLSEAVQLDDEHPVTPGERLDLTVGGVGQRWLVRTVDPERALMVGAGMTFGWSQVTAYQLAWPDDNERYEASEIQEFYS